MAPSVLRRGRVGVRGAQGEAAPQQPLHPPPPLRQLHLLRLGLPRVSASLGGRGYDINSFVYLPRPEYYRWEMRARISSGKCVLVRSGCAAV